MKKIMIRITNFVIKLIGALVAFFIFALALSVAQKAAGFYEIAFLFFLAATIFFLLVAEDLLMFILFLVATFVASALAFVVVYKDSLPDAPRPAIKIAENYYQECNGNNLYVYKYEDRLAVEPSDIQVIANDASCTGEK